MTKERFTVGKIVNTHGLRGELKVQYYTETIEDFDEFDYLMIDGEGDKKFEIESIRSVKNTVLVKFNEFSDINQVERFKNREVYYLREDYPELEEGQYYIVDLIGLTVVDHKLGKVGTLKDVLKNTAQDLYVVKKMDGKGEFYIPMVEQFIKRIDLAEKTIYVELIEGMM